MARGGSSKTSGSPALLPAPPLPRSPGTSGFVSLRPIKEFVRKLPLGHPLRIIVLSEPDEIDGDECFVKLTVWLRLLPEK